MAMRTGKSNPTDVGRLALAGLVVGVVLWGAGCEGDESAAVFGGGGVAASGNGLVSVPATPVRAPTGGGTNATAAATSASRFVGTWTLYEGSVAAGTPTWYVHFASNGSFFISNESNGAGVRVRGTYAVTNGALVGPFTNPGTGEGRVEAVIAGDGVLQLDFIEYWHTPHKVIHYAGRKR